MTAGSSIGSFDVGHGLAFNPGNGLKFKLMLSRTRGGVLADCNFINPLKVFTLKYFSQA